MADKVAPYKYLSGGISFIPSIPRNQVNDKTSLSLDSTLELILCRMERSYVQSFENWLKWILVAQGVTTTEYAQLILLRYIHLRPLRFSHDQTCAYTNAHFCPNLTKPTSWN
jgi:hypothetical protein